MYVWGKRAEMTHHQQLDAFSQHLIVEKGLTANNCFLDLSRIPRPYLGGLLTTNSMVSLNTLGLETEPRGYTQSSIATIRLWKERSER